MASSDSRARRRGHKRVSHGAWRWWIEAIGPGPFARTRLRVLVGNSHWRCELLDGGALAAQQLKRSDVAKRLAAAWHAAPTLTRLLRWLVTEDRSPTALRAKARRIVSRCPKTAGRQLGLLRLLGGDISAAAALLAQAPGLGWSSDEHPGHILFPSFAVLLAHRTSRKVSDTLLADLDSDVSRSAGGSLVR